LGLLQGFNSSFGYLSGAEDHYLQTRDGYTDFWRSERRALLSTFAAADESIHLPPPIHIKSRSLSSLSLCLLPPPFALHPFFFLFLILLPLPPPRCRPPPAAPVTLSEPAYGENGTSYSTFLYTAEALKLVRAHDTATPFFLYLAYQNVYA